MIATPPSIVFGGARRGEGICHTHSDERVDDWLEVLAVEIAQFENEMKQCPIVVDLSNGTFSRSQVQDCLIQLYPFVKMLPEWVGLIADKGSDCRMQALLMRYRGITKWYVPQWIDMAEEFDVHCQELFESPVRNAVETLNQYMWCVSRGGSALEGMMTLVYAIGNVMRFLAPSILIGFKHYERRTGMVLSKKARGWIRHQALSNDMCIRESHEIAKSCLLSKQAQTSVTRVVSQSLTYLLMALGECGVRVDPWNPNCPTCDMAA